MSDGGKIREGDYLYFRFDFQKLFGEVMEVGKPYIHVYSHGKKYKILPHQIISTSRTHD